MENGDDRGAFSYANMVYRGYGGIPKNEEEGIKVMSQLAQKGHPYAQMNLAAIIMRTQPDQVASAVKLYELAGQAGLNKAYSELGRMYRLGYGVHQDHKKAIDYFKKGAQTGNPQCNFMLGVYCSSGLGNDERKPEQEKAFKHFQKAAVKGLAEAQYNVGLRFLKGHGVEANSFNAVEFFRMAALQGFQLAQVNLAGMYSEGRGVKSDLDEARGWLQKAAAGGGSIGKDAQKRLDELDEIQGKKKDKCTIM
ncbi:MAG: sel1 repeat family protein [Paenibacillus sp.]|nr:sel1 repeat family protein [Paenibacillus sp.]